MKVEARVNCSCFLQTHQGKNKNTHATLCKKSLFSWEARLAMELESPAETASRAHFCPIYYTFSVSNYQLQTQLNTPNMTVPFCSFMAVTVSSARIRRKLMTYFLIFLFNFCLNFLQLFLTLIWTHFQAFPKHPNAKNCKQCRWNIVCVHTRNNCGSIAKQNWKENKRVIYKNKHEDHNCFSHI